MREQIAKDKAEREAALRKEKEQSSATAQQQQQQKPTTAPVKKEYDTCRLQVSILSMSCTIVLFLKQIRLFGGGTLTHTFKATDTLVDVNRHILMNRTDDGSPYSLVTSFPKKVFQPVDMERSLKELG